MLRTNVRRPQFFVFTIDAFLFLFTRKYLSIYCENPCPVSNSMHYNVEIIFLLIYVFFLSCSNIMRNHTAKRTIVIYYRVGTILWFLDILVKNIWGLTWVFISFNFVPLYIVTVGFPIFSMQMARILFIKSLQWVKTFNNGVWGHRSLSTVLSIISFHPILTMPENPSDFFIFVSILFLFFNKKKNSYLRFLIMYILVMSSPYR